MITSCSIRRVVFFIYTNIYVYNKRKHEAKASSLLDHLGHLGHFDVPIFDAEAQVFDARSFILRSLMLSSRCSISELRCRSFDSRYLIFDAKVIKIRKID